MSDSEVKTSVDGVCGPTVRRSLHMIWIIDDSYSMVGEKIQMVNHAISSLIPDLRNIQEDAQIDIFVRAISFGSSANWHLGPDPVSLDEFQWTPLDGSSGSTSYCSAIECLMPALELDNIGKRSVPPVILFMSDGYSTDPEDNFIELISRLNEMPWGKKAVRLSLGIGEEGDFSKEQLDAFISPYLRDETRGKMETISASRLQDIYKYIRVTSIECAAASSKSQSRNKKSEIPVEINMEKIEEIKITEDGGVQGIDWDTISETDVF